VTTGRPNDSTPIAERLSQWFATLLGVDTVRVRDLRQHTEGFSWQTWTLTVEWELDGVPTRRGFAVRRQPEDGLLAPYDIEQQYRIHRAVADSSTVPMPELIALELDRSHLGMPFYVMERLEGHVPVQWQPEDPIAFPTDAARRALGHEFVDVLARIHAIDWHGSGLAGNGLSSDDAARAQVDHWERFYVESRLIEVPHLRAAISWLHANIATSGRVSLCHGDYRLGNFMIRDGHIVGVFDWELAHVSDPVEDIAYCGLRLFRGRSPLMSQLLPSDEFFARYEQVTGLAVAPDVLAFWTVLGYVKASASHVRACRAFEDGSNGDLRLAAMGHQLLHVLRGLAEELDLKGDR
jgi:aminoglycoside phosphotransferase (APT) family kinase protein